MKPLYEITTDYLTFLNDLYESDTITDEQMELLDQFKDSIESKMINIAAFVKNLESEHISIERAIDHMSERSNKILNKIEKIKTYLKKNMEIINIKEIKSPYFDIKLKTNPPSVIIDDESLLPEKYIKQQIFYKVDKHMICQELKNNVSIPGVLLEQKSRLEIK